MVKLYSYELQNRNEIECYDKVMELYLDYFTIWFIITLGYKLKAIEYFIEVNYSTINQEIDKGKILYQIYQYTFYIIYDLSIIEIKLNIME